MDIYLLMLKALSGAAAFLALVNAPIILMIRLAVRYPRLNGKLSVAAFLSFYFLVWAPVVSLFGIAMLGLN